MHVKSLSRGVMFVLPNLPPNLKTDYNERG